MGVLIVVVCVSCVCCCCLARAGSRARQSLFWARGALVKCYVECRSKGKCVGAEMGGGSSVLCAVMKNKAKCTMFMRCGWVVVEGMNVLFERERDATTSCLLLTRSRSE